MGLFGLFFFVLKCFKLLAWPSFALGYPLCASIQATETNCKYHMRKMVTYWILFSLICLFEHTFSGLLQWLPVWPYAKILAIFWLVIPRFDGAFIAYDSLVSPCLSLQLLQVVLDLLNKNQNLSLEGESFLVVAQRYVDEHGTEALEKLISLKPKNIEPTFSEADIKEVESLNQSSAPAENKTTEKLNTNLEVKNMTLPSPLEENAQREWTCAVCLVTTSSKATLNSHLLGRKHRARCEELKVGKQTTEKVVTVGGPNRVRYCTICQVKTSEETWNSHVQGKKHKSKCKELKAIVKEAKNNNFLRTATNNSGVNYSFGCDICEVMVQSEATLRSHLLGKKHKLKSEELKARESNSGHLEPALHSLHGPAPMADQ
ncbi:C2H2-type domain-containing protein [Heracleum sosnowskyi]|uniref:HVA22-like protein n=1 Tax=Heracleum sosnowskyi TaxID=360622 RepID=A0AAD8JCR1_9APIA|nr:C2H2-type domain-containing protein [Heracleum sosnowskyi]